MTYGYVRISTGGQDDGAQRSTVNDYCARHGVKLDTWIVEQTSSRKRRADREVSALIAKLQHGDTVIVSELSRLARSSTMELGAILQDVRERGATVVVVQDNLKIGPEATDVAAEAVIFALGISARIERDLISFRTRAGLQARKAAGVKLGRPKGSSKLKVHDAEIARYLKLGINRVDIAKLLGVSRSTLYSYLGPKRGKP